MARRNEVKRVWKSKGWEGKYSEHDDHVNDGIRRVSFKRGSNHKGKYGRRRGVITIFRSQLDDDVDMSVQGSNGRRTRFNQYVGRGRNQAGGGFGCGMNADGRGSANRKRSGHRSPPASIHFDSEKLLESSTPQYKVTDGADLSSRIRFDVDEDQHLPESKGIYLCAEEGMSFVRQFLEQYFHLYDSDDREHLVSAYHNDAMFSVTSAYPPRESSTTSPKLVDYITHSRNLFRVEDSTRRQRCLYQGKMAIVACLSKLPKTQHDPQSFAVDLTLFMPQLISVSVTGLFMERGLSKDQPLRSFSRVFMIVPFGDGFCIANEQLFVTNATDEQRKAAFQTQLPAVMPPPTPVVAPVGAFETQVPAVMPPPTPVVAPVVAFKMQVPAVLPPPTPVVAPVAAFKTQVPAVLPPPTPVVAPVAAFKTQVPAVMPPPTPVVAPVAAFKTQVPAVLPPPTPVVAPVPAATGLLDDDAKQQWAESFAAQSGMNVCWARKCLDDNGWDFQRAAFIFTEMNKQGIIPASAFIK